MNLGLLVVSLAIALAVLVLVSLWSAGRFARQRRGRPSTAIPPGRDAPLDPQAPTDDPRLALIVDPAEALAVRSGSARLARRSLDLLYYIWEDDLTGRLLAAEILDAADRGVRVRLILDDVNVLGRDPVYRPLDQHPNIEVRLFNPVRNRDRGLLRGIELLFTLLPYNRRMHGKLWIADNRVAITGGRNVGDAYFGHARAPRPNYRDLDLMMTGPLVADSSALFDHFWNSAQVVPIRSLLPGRKRHLRRFRARLRRRLSASGLVAPGPETLERLIDSAPRAPSARLVGDPPEKAVGQGQRAWLPQALIPLLLGAQHKLTLLTPYFVPGTQGLAQLLDLRRRGVALNVITNGLPLADNLFVHGAYRWYRPRLLLAGTAIFEAAPDPATPLMLHAKAALIDDRTAFVGSFNFDMRSTFLNTELGVVFSDPEPLDALRALIGFQQAPAQSWRLTHDGARTLWQRDTGAPRDTEPGSTRPRRLLTWALGHLPIHRFL